MTFLESMTLHCVTRSGVAHQTNTSVVCSPEDIQYISIMSLIDGHFITVRVVGCQREAGRERREEFGQRSPNGCSRGKEGRRDEGHEGDREEVGWQREREEDRQQRRRWRQEVREKESNPLSSKPTHDISIIIFKEEGDMNETGNMRGDDEGMNSSNFSASTLFLSRKTMGREERRQVLPDVWLLVYYQCPSCSLPFSGSISHSLISSLSLK